MGISLNLSEILGRQTRIQGEKTEQRQVFPVSYAWYENNPVAMVKIVNNEPNAITGISLSFYLERYMSEATTFAVLPFLAPGEKAEFPVTALFNESMLDLTENITANAIVLINYRSLGAKKQAEFAVQMPIYHRNAMSWDDDRRAASFVSAKDPAAALFAKYTASVIRKRRAENPAMFSRLPENVQYALALFEALNVYGINYIIDPKSSYIAMSENASALDSLNYPYQTLFYRGGDCDDLSILFCSLLEVLGIDTAFVTVPGHIFMAFDTGAPPDAGAPEAVIELDGKFWMPVEITVPGEGFAQAVRIGAREWRSAGEEGKLYPMRESWELYPAVSVPTSGGQLPDMPDEGAILRAIEKELNKR
jgi:transglutaminase-like putative cysteine protease